MISKSIKLCEKNPVFHVRGKIETLDCFDSELDRVIVVGCDHHAALLLKVVQASNHVVIIGFVRSADVIVDRTLSGLRDLALLYHIGPSDKFDR